MITATAMLCLYTAIISLGLCAIQTSAERAEARDAAAHAAHMEAGRLRALRLLPQEIDLFDRIAAHDEARGLTVSAAWYRDRAATLRRRLAHAEAGWPAVRAAA